MILSFFTLQNINSVIKKLCSVFTNCTDLGTLSRNIHIALVLKTCVNQSWYLTLLNCCNTLIILECSLRGNMLHDIFLSFK